MALVICNAVIVLALGLIILIFIDSTHQKIISQNQKYYERSKELMELQEKHYELILYEIVKLRKEIENYSLKI